MRKHNFGIVMAGKAEPEHVYMKPVSPPGKTMTYFSTTN